MKKKTKIDNHRHCPDCSWGILEEIVYDQEGTICKCNNCKKLYRWYVDNNKLKKIKILTK